MRHSRRFGALLLLVGLAVALSLPVSGQSTSFDSVESTHQILVMGGSGEAGGFDFQARQEPLGEVLDRLQSSSGIRVAYSPDRIGVHRHVTLEAHGASPEKVLERLAEALGLRVRKTVLGQFVLVPAPSVESVEREDKVLQGAIEGRVLRTDGRPVEQATVQVTGTELGAFTDADGGFRITGVPPGSHTLKVSKVGFQSVTRRISVSEGETTRVTFDGMQITSMEEIVVTGTRVRTKRRNLSTPVSVITSEEVERTNPTSIVDLFESNQVPGVVSLDLGADSDWNQKIQIRGENSPLSVLVPCVRLLVDGRETQLRALSAISAQSIERVEVIRGAQAATLYGSDASCGVIQLFTKDGSGVEGEKLTAQLRYGITQSPYVEGTPNHQDLSVNLLGNMGAGSYNLSANYRTEDGYVPEYDREMKSVSIGFQRSVEDRFRVSASARFYDKDFGSPGASAIWYDLYRNDRLPSNYGAPDPNDNYNFRTLDVGFTVDYTPAPWISHRLSAGMDLTSMRGLTLPNPDAGPSDTVMSSAKNEYELPSIRYMATVEPEIEGPVSLSLTTGIDWANQQWLSLSDDYPQNTFPFNNTVGGYVWEEEYVKTGIFGQVQFVHESGLSVNAGLRGEHHSNFGEEFGDWSVNPRIGAAYAFDLGDGNVIKPRGSWGSGISAPTGRMKFGGPPFAEPNPDLGPQETEGWELGVDADLLEGSLHTEVTYFDQTTDNAYTVNYIEFPYPFQYVNGGVVSNVGTEFLVEWTSEPVRVSANFTWVDNTVEEINEEGGGANEVGKPIARPPVPQTSGGLQVTYSAGRALGLGAPGAAQAGFGVDYTGERWALDWGQFFGALREGTYSGNQADYTGAFDGFAKANAFFSYDLSEGYTLDLRINNLFDSLRQPTPDYVVPGRQIEFGIKAEI